MNEWKARWPIVGDVRGLGPMMLAEFVRDRRTKDAGDAGRDAADRPAGGRQRRGRHARGTLQQLRSLLPPLTISEDVLHEGLNALGHAIETVAERLAAAPV